MSKANQCPPKTPIGGGPNMKPLKHSKSNGPAGQSNWSMKEKSGKQP